MRTLILAITFALLCPTAYAKSPPRSQEVEVITGQAADPARLEKATNQERLGEICQTTSLLLKHLKIERSKDAMTRGTMEWLMRLSCAAKKSD